MTTFHSEPYEARQRLTDDEACAALWDALTAAWGLIEAKDEDLGAWTRQRLDTIVQALKDDRLARLRSKPVVSLSEYKEALQDQNA